MNGETEAKSYPAWVNRACRTESRPAEDRQTSSLEAEPNRPLPKTPDSSLVC